MRIKNLLKKYNLRAKKSLGQHFLVDKNILDKIIKAAELSKKDVVLEVGAGLGTLTKELSQRAKKVIAVEIDRKMAEILRETLKNVENVEIVEGDILKLNPKSEILISKQIQNSKFKIVANIPYQITSPLLEKFLTGRNKPKEMVLLVQKEVAEKICCRPPQMNRLGIFVQFYGKPEIIAKVSKNCFWPKPVVDSAILKISEISTKRDKQEKLFFDLVRKGFSQKRKQLKNIFDQQILKKAGILPKKRAETLSINQWLKIYNTLKEKNVHEPGSPE